MKSVELALALGLGLFAIACDGSGSSGALPGGPCPTFVPCGGNIVGTWHLKSTCIKSAPKDAGCSLQSVGFNMGPGYDATYTFNANGTFTASMRGTVQQTLSYPGPACARSDASTAEFCADLQRSIQNAYAASGDAGTLTLIKSLSASCSASGSGDCKCDENFTYNPYSMDGTYATSGDRLTVTMTTVSFLGDGGIGDAGAGSPVVYCVSGNTLTWGPAPESADEGEGVIVFTK
jgi:hypothetical protein